LFGTRRLQNGVDHCRKIATLRPLSHGTTPYVQECERLNVWKKAVDLAVDVYQVTLHFPKSELYGLTSQLRRSSVSIASNLAEGSGRGSDGELARFLAIAKGSATELHTQLLIASRVGLLPSARYQDLSRRLQEVRKMLNGFLSRLRRPAPPAPKT
jgi:four helix bundle protein